MAGEGEALHAERFEQAGECRRVIGGRRFFNGQGRALAVTGRVPGDDAMRAAERGELVQP